MARIFEMDPNRMRDLPDETGEETDDDTIFEIIEPEEEDLDLDEDDDETIDTVDWVSNQNRSRGRWDLEMAPRDDFDRRFVLPNDEEFDEAS
jgi:hypothetical protein